MNGSWINVTPSPEFLCQPLPWLLIGVWVLVAAVNWSEGWSLDLKKLLLVEWTAFMFIFWAWAMMGGTR